MEKKITIQQAKEIYQQGNVSQDAQAGFVVLKNIGKVYDGRVQAVFNFNLAIEQHEFIVFVGPSGCGKSTTLRMVAGLEEITDGQLYIDGVLANYLESKDRNIAMVFQSYALYPNMTVYDNIGFGLSVRGVDKETIRQKVYDAASILDLGPYLDRKPKELSGGQMQRVALGRAIVRDAKLFLMDEPLSNLDAKLRVQMRSEIVKLHRNIGATTIYVTHDQTEAMTMASRIVVMNKGIIQQVGTPMDIYNNPQNIFVATFIGNPPMNVIPVTMDGGKLVDGANVVTLPKTYVETHENYIQQRKQYFTTLTRLADNSRELDLIAKINDLCKNIKRKKIADADLYAVVEEIANLASEITLVDFTDDNKRDLLDGASACDKDLVVSMLSTLAKELSQTDLTVSGMLKTVESAGFNVKKDEVAVEKGKKSQKAQPQQTLAQENMQKTQTYLDAYSASDASQKIMLGIRPENIHFYEDNVKHKSEKLTVTADFVELLGSEFCIHFNLFGSRLIMKTGIERMVSIGEQIDVCLDMDKVKLFDAVSGAIVCGNK